MDLHAKPRATRARVFGTEREALEPDTRELLLKRTGTERGDDLQSRAVRPELSNLGAARTELSQQHTAHRHDLFEIRDGVEPELDRPIGRRNRLPVPLELQSDVLSDLWLDGLERARDRGVALRVIARSL